MVSCFHVVSPTLLISKELQAPWFCKSGSDWPISIAGPAAHLELHGWSLCFFFRSCGRLSWYYFISVEGQRKATKQCRFGPPLWPGAPFFFLLSRWDFLFWSSWFFCWSCFAGAAAAACFVLAVAMVSFMSFISSYASLSYCPFIAVAGGLDRRCVSPWIHVCCLVVYVADLRLCILCHRLHGSF
jgi:hypothetical protein